MPTFDFFETGVSVTTASGSNSDTSVTHTADGIQFTISITSPDDQFWVAMGGDRTDSATPHLYLANSGNGPDIFRLTLQSTANPGNNLMVGTALNPVAVQMDDWAERGSFKVSFTDSINGTATVVDSTVTPNELVTAVGSFTGIVFTSSAADTAATILSVSMNSLECFCEGTLIATPSGARAVEALSAGDEILTADGRTVAIRWLGQTVVEPSLANPALVSPVRIAQGALGQGLPERDLLVSAEHAIALDGKLVNAGALLNGTTIRREKRTEPFAYFHVETDAHELILAEGVAVETYLEQRSDIAFDNAGTRLSRIVPEMDLPRVTSRRLMAARAA